MRQGKRPYCATTNATCSNTWTFGLEIDLITLSHVTGLQWVHQDFTAKKNQKGKKAKAVVNMSLGGLPGQVGTADEVLSSKSPTHYSFLNCQEISVNQLEIRYVSARYN